MRIAVNCRFLLSKRLEGIGWYTFELLKGMARQHPETEFLCFFDRKIDPSFLVEPNMKAIVLHPAARHPFLFYAWFQWSVKWALAKYEADVFFSPDGFLCINTKVPTLLSVHDLAYVAYPGALNWMDLWHYRYFMPKFIRRADQIVTVSDFVKKDLLNHFPITAGKTNVVHNGLRDGFDLVSDNIQLETRNELSAGKPYFFYLGAIHPRKNVQRLIEAFDHFASNNPSLDHHLVIGGRLAWMSGPLKISLAQAKHRNRIHLIGSVDDDKLPQITGSAFAVVYLSLYEGFGLPVIEAMQAGIPVITSQKSAMAEVAGTAALLADPLSIHSMASAMLEIATDEKLRRSLVEAGRKRVRDFSWDKAASGIYNILSRMSRPR